MPQGIKKENDYQAILTPEFYEKTPKSVLAAILVSLMLNYVDGDEKKVQFEILKEWKTLYDNGIVPQKPFK